MELKMMNQYLKDGRVKNMENVFYIVQCPYVSQEWWLLLLRDTHQVVSTSPTKAGILENVQQMVKKYKTSDNIYNAMSKTEYKINPNTIAQRKELYKVYECLLPEVERAVRLASKEVNTTGVPMKVKFKKVTPFKALAF